MEITSDDFEEGTEIPKKCGYKFENRKPLLAFSGYPDNVESLALIMDDPDAMGAVGKVWVHWLIYHKHPRELLPDNTIEGKNDFGEIGYGGPAPPDKRHTYIFKLYALNTQLDLENGFSKQELEESMADHILAEAKLTGTFAP